MRSKPQIVSSVNAPNNSVLSTDFSSCTCDLTPNGCDHRCCCDTACDSQAVAKWRLTPGLCLDELFDSTIVNVDDCIERAQQAVLEDLQGGLYTYQKQTKAALCTQSKSDQSITNYFIDSMFKADTVADFESVRDAEVQDTTSYTFLKPPVNDTVLKNPTLGYQPMEYLKGSRLVDGVELLRNGDRVSFVRPGIFGHCEYNTPALFMQNAEDDTCVVVHEAFKKSTCENKVAFKSVANMKLRINPNTTDTIEAKIG